MDSCLFQRYLRKGKRKQSSSGFYLCSAIPFLMKTQCAKWSMYIYIYIYIYIAQKQNSEYSCIIISKVGNRSRGWPEGSFFYSYYTDANPFSGLLHFILDTYLILLSVKQGGIKYHFKSLWYDVTWDWTPISRTIDEHPIHKPIYYNFDFKKLTTKSEDKHKKENLLNMVSIFFTYCINRPLKRFACH